MTALPERFKASISACMADITHGRFDVLVMSGRLATELREGVVRVIAEYRRTPIDAPTEQVWSLVEIYPRDDDPHAYLVEVPMWTAEEGRSDLTVTLRLTDLGNEVRTEVLDVGVL